MCVQGRPPTNRRVARRKYCLAYRQGEIGIETKEIEGMYQYVLESEIDQKVKSDYLEGILWR